jgi:preprotein translocase subunit SecE
MADKIKLLVAFLLIVAGVAAYYALQESATVVRVLVILLAVVMAGGLAFTTASGRQFFAFAQDSVAEAKRVVWPSRKETLQTTIVVIVFAFVMALFLWAVDASLMMMINQLMGRK